MNTGGTMPNIAIGFPSGENVSAQFALHLANLTMKNTIPISVVANANSSRISLNRNMIVELAKQANSTHLFFIDADMIFPPDSLQILLNHDKDIIGATASKRSDEDNQAIGATLDNSPLHVPSSPVKMGFLGCCLMLIKMSVFDKLKKPYFCEPPNSMLKDDGIMAEDEYFCHNVIKAGIDIWCDPELSVHIGHRGAKTYYIKPPKLTCLQSIIRNEPTS